MIGYIKCSNPCCQFKMMKRSVNPLGRLLTRSLLLTSTDHNLFPLISMVFIQKMLKRQLPLFWFSMLAAFEPSVFPGDCRHWYKLTFDLYECLRQWLSPSYIIPLILILSSFDLKVLPRIIWVLYIITTVYDNVYVLDYYLK